MSKPKHTTAKEDFEDAAKGFDAVFGDDVVKAKEILSANSSAFHQLGLGMVSFLQAALGLEDALMVDAAKALTDSEASTNQALKASKSHKSLTRFPAGMEWEVLHADTVVLLGLTQALSESYMGYLKCLYSLNSAHGAFTKLFKRVFPNGLDNYSGPSVLPLPSEKPSSSSLTVNNIASGNSSRGLLSRLTASAPASASSTPRGSGTVTPAGFEPEGALEELIFYGVAFGFGLFNLVFSLLPAKVKRLVGFFGYQSDRRLGLQALSVAATGKDIHSNFAALTILTYEGLKLLLAGYQANEKDLIERLSRMLESLEARFPHGSLWLLNRAKLLRYQTRPEEAIEVLQKGLGPSRPVKFKQADALLNFELAWDLLSVRRYQESAEAWLRMLELNTWSHATYTYLAAGCYLALKTEEGLGRAQELFDKLPSLLMKKRPGGQDLPTEIYVQKKIAFWKAKMARWNSSGSQLTHYAQCVRVNPAEELGVFWNTHGRIPHPVASAHIAEFIRLTPVPAGCDTVESSDWPASSLVGTRNDLDTEDELQFRNLFLGIANRALGEFDSARRLLLSAANGKATDLVGTWMAPMAHFEAAVLAMLEVQALERESSPDASLNAKWVAAIDDASKHLDEAASRLGDTDLSSRLESRITMLRDELHSKKATLG
ncbi:hypothetical protein M407DRAFT_73614 [Tulasnella calospora MUT 4182]|uniref:Mitochondrial outer membrane protein IML2 n=1 Tax=Tulasnella calospora MUT 4182 TaxID=1051891 RepID=A0A0C3L0D3_9AGAM|nr:hypothetical protein M407DRAFT_73614 [Tulasnella calospora MUT 4182]